MSAAIPIKRPPTVVYSPLAVPASIPSGPDGISNHGAASGSSGSPAPPSNDRSKDEKKLCRNILIYGSCRFQDKGCLYSHGQDNTNKVATPSLAAAAANAAVFVPSGAGGSGGGAAPAKYPLVGMGVDAQEFVPAGSNGSDSIDHVLPSGSSLPAAASTSQIGGGAIIDPSSSRHSESTATAHSTEGSQDFVEDHQLSDSYDKFHLQDDYPTPQLSAVKQNSVHYHSNQQQQQPQNQHQQQFHRQDRYNNYPPHSFSPMPSEPSSMISSDYGAAASSSNMRGGGMDEYDRAGGADPYDYGVGGGNDDMARMRGQGPPSDYYRGGDSSGRQLAMNDGSGFLPHQQEGMSHSSMHNSTTHDGYHADGQNATILHPGFGGPTRAPLQYHLYHPTPASSSLQKLHSTSSTLPSFFLPPSLHIALSRKLEELHASPTFDMKLPEQVGDYAGLVTLEKKNAHGPRPPNLDGENSTMRGSWLGYKSHSYKAWKLTDGKAYILKRIEGFRLQHESAIALVELWSRLKHPGLVSVKESFTTRQFGDHSIVFVYDYWPCSETLQESHFGSLTTLPPPNPWSTNKNLHGGQHSDQSGYRHQTQSHNRDDYLAGGGGGRQGGGGGSGAYNHSSALSGAVGGGGSTKGLPESVLWSYLVQLGSAIRTIHRSALAVRNLEMNRILLTGQNRIRIGSCGILDVLSWGEGGSLVGYQQEDLIALGKLIIALAVGSINAVQNLPKSIDHISRQYSPDLKNIILYLLSKPSPRKTIEEVLSMMEGRILDELNSSFTAGDTLEAELTREIENGRLVRLLTKFGFINERPEFDHDPRWAETGDRYIIKLFRDYVFHQVDENGRPVTDLSHVLTSLNKLDAGSDEKIMLVSRDEQSCLIVSYREVKNCIESAFLDLSR